MTNPFFDRPILNSPYAYPVKHWELDEDGQPTQKVVERRRRADFVTPIPKAKKQGASKKQAGLQFADALGLDSADQSYAHTAVTG